MYAFVARSSALALDGACLVTLRQADRAVTVREDVYRYETGLGDLLFESEGSERRTLGSVSLELDARWTGTLTVPVPDGNVAFVELERHGELPHGYRGSEQSAHFSLPSHELDAVVTLLAGMVDQARHDGVLASDQSPRTE